MRKFLHVVLHKRIAHFIQLFNLSGSPPPFIIMRPTMYTERHNAQCIATHSSYMLFKGSGWFGHRCRNSDSESVMDFTNRSMIVIKWRFRDISPNVVFSSDYFFNAPWARTTLKNADIREEQIWILEQKQIWRQEGSCTLASPTDCVRFILKIIVIHVAHFDGNLTIVFSFNIWWLCLWWSYITCYFNHTIYGESIPETERKI